MTDSPVVASRTKERLKWIAPIGLALLVVCLGCFFFFAMGQVGSSEVIWSGRSAVSRLWAISERRQSGVGLQRMYPIQRDGQSCIRVDVTFFFWRPALSIETVTSDNCG